MEVKGDDVAASRGSAEWSNERTRSRLQTQSADISGGDICGGDIRSGQADVVGRTRQS